MPQSLAPRPNLDYLRNLAKQRLAELRRNDPSLKLADAQHAIARGFGFANWQELHAHVTAVREEHLAKIAGAFVRFAEQECRGVSPLYEQLSAIVSRAPELQAIALHGKAPIPNLFFAAVHYLLHAARDEPLSAYYPSVGGTRAMDGELRAVFAGFCAAHREEIIRLQRTRLVQTNEVARGGYLLPAFRHVWELGGRRPLALIEVGTAAGLNLCCDKYAYTFGDGVWHGDAGSPVQVSIVLRGANRPPAAPSPVPIARRIGIDLAPIGADDPEAVRWLESLVWPEHRDRLERLRGALAIAGQTPMELHCGDANTLIGPIVGGCGADVTVCVFQTHALNQFSQEARGSFLAALAELGEAREVFLVSRHSELTLDRYAARAHETRRLANTDGHGRWIEWLS